MNEWAISYDKFVPAKEGIRESLFTLGNGYFAIRGAAEESVADKVHYPGTYLAGGYNRLTTAIQGEVIENEDLVNFPNCLPLKFKIGDGSWFNLKDVKILSYEHTLNLKEGVLSRKIHFRDKEGRQTRFSIRRLVSMDDPHVVAIEMIIYAENWDGDIEILSALDTDGLKMRALNVIKLSMANTWIYRSRCSGGPDLFKGHYKSVPNIHGTGRSYSHISQWKRTKGNDKDAIQGRSIHSQRFQIKASKDQPLIIEKMICIYTF